MNNLSAHQLPPPPQAASLTQQFCLRWHNHQSSLLTSLPLLLDQSHLTDVTLSAEGRTVRAHRVVLSACSSFFSELFRTMEPPFHPVIVIPGASFGAVVALLTFMYSGEVNVFEEQISTLLSLAETLGIKGLADFGGNAPKSSPTNHEASSMHKDTDASPTRATPTPPSASHPMASSLSTSSSSSSAAAAAAAAATAAKLSLPLENMFAKSFQFCPSMIANPLNFSPSAISRGAEIFARYQTQCRLNQQQQQQQVQLDHKPIPGSGGSDSPNVDENGNTKSFLNIEAKGRKSKIADMRKIDKIAESLRSASSSSTSMGGKGSAGGAFGDHHQDHMSKQLMAQSSPIASPMVMKASPAFGNLSHRYTGTPSIDDIKTPMDFMSAASGSGANSANTSTHSHTSEPTTPDQPMVDKSMAAAAAAAACLTSKPANSKLYATCFICHKQLSNQYNLRVHLETHQNVRYACSVCTHVSRSKDALRKHVSYRHPGAPSPCDSESKRKRSRTSTSAALAQQHQQLQQQLNIPSSSPSTMASSPIIKNEVINDLSMTTIQSFAAAKNPSPLFGHYPSPHMQSNAATTGTNTVSVSPASTTSSSEALHEQRPSPIAQSNADCSPSADTHSKCND